MKTPLKLQVTNTSTGKKELFVPGNPDGPVSMYVCGVTPYAHAHLGHGRCYVSFDVIYRTLKFFGHEVCLVRNVTDVDDKIVAKAAERGGDLQQHAAAVAQEFTQSFAQDMRALQVNTPDDEPTVSGHIDKIIQFISDLIAKGHAYQAGGDVYFSIASLPSYGQLSGRTLDDMVAGARVAVNAAKRAPGDFVLWKGNVTGSFWQSPWGAGRPGWHIECSAFINTYLGDTIDIHGGGQDLIFPHHENEQAQSCARSGKPLARYWLHNAHVTLRKEKMSKSLGNVSTLRDLFAEFDPMVLRFYLLQHHYRTPIDFSPEHLTAAARAYKRLVRGLSGTAESAHLTPDQCPAEFVDALCDDFNTPKLLGLVFAQLDEIGANPARATLVRNLLQQVLGLSCAPLAEKEVAVSPEIAELLARREAARAAKDWATADALRDQLTALGYVVQDTK